MWWTAGLYWGDSRDPVPPRPYPLSSGGSARLRAHRASFHGPEDAEKHRHRLSASDKDDSARVASKQPKTLFRHPPPTEGDNAAST